MKYGIAYDRGERAVVHVGSHSRRKERPPRGREQSRRRARKYLDTDGLAREVHGLGAR
jgi:hypothetical protein